MRNISIFAILPAIVALAFPQTALANGTINTNTKIEFEMSENAVLTNDVIANGLLKIPYNYEGYVPIEQKEDAEHSKILAKWKAKQKSGNLPSDKFTINASAYTAAADECGKSDGITASGLKVKEKRTLACPPAFPFGTKISIEGVGELRCEDRGGAIKGNHFDIYMETKAEAFAFGRKHLVAEVIQ